MAEHRVQSKEDFTPDAVLGYNPYPDCIIGHYRSHKMNSLLPYRSEMARDCMALFDYDQAVTEFRAMPFRLEFYENGQLREYAPDVIAVRDLKVVLVHCRPFPRWQSTTEQTGLGLASAWCVEHGCEIEVLRGLSSLREQPYFDNVMLLSRFAQGCVQTEETDLAYQYLNDAGGSVTVSALARKLGGGNIPHGTAKVLCMAYWHMVEVPVRAEEISLDTRVWMPGTFQGGNGKKSA